MKEMLSRRASGVEAGLPYLTAEIDGMVVGYSYATTYRPRPAYRYTIEDSVYVADGLGRRGIGAALLHSLIDRCEAGPWRQMLAVIGDSGNLASIALHRRLGFQFVRHADISRVQARPVGRHRSDAARPGSRRHHVLVIATEPLIRGSTW